VANIVVKQTLVVGTTANFTANLWTPIISKNGGLAISDPAVMKDIKRVLFQLRGGTPAAVVNGNAYLFPDGNASLPTTGVIPGLLLAAGAPAAGPTYPPSFLDEVPCPHNGEWWCLADTTGLVLVVWVWI